MTIGTEGRLQGCVSRNLSNKNKIEFSCFVIGSLIAPKSKVVSKGQTRIGRGGWSQQGRRGWASVDRRAPGSRQICDEQRILGEKMYAPLFSKMYYIHISFPG